MLNMVHVMTWKWLVYIYIYEIKIALFNAEISATVLWCKLTSLHLYTLLLKGSIGRNSSPTYQVFFVRW